MIRLRARAEFLAYPTARLIEAAVTGVRREGDAFVLESEREEVVASRIVVAFGMRVRMPDVAGLTECWGRSAFQCPYCHGYEAADR